MPRPGSDEREYERGATSTEYGLLVVGIAIAIVGGTLLFGTELVGFLGALGDAVVDWADGLA